MSTTPDLSWMGQRSTYQGPSLTEIKALEHKKQTAKQTLFINKLPETVTKIDLRALFVSIGCTVVDCRIVYKQHKSTGIAYVDLADEADVKKGLELDQTECQGAKIFVRRHVSREKLHEIVSKKGFDTNNSYNNRRAKVKSKNVCFDFQKGTCKRGDSCRFQHNNSDNNGKSLKNEKKKKKKKKKKKMKRDDDVNNNNNSSSSGSSGGGVKRKKHVEEDDDINRNNDRFKRGKRTN